MAVKRGDVAIVTYGELGRPRPVVIVQSDDLGDETTTVLACPITSVLTNKLPIRPVLDAGADTGLHVRSQIMTDKMLAVPRDRVRRVLGSLDSTSAGRLDRALLVVLGVAR